MWLLVISFVIYLWIDSAPSSHRAIAYSVFKQELNSNNVQQVIIENSQIKGSFRLPISLGDNSEQTLKTSIPSFGDNTLLALLEQNKVEIESVSGSTPL